MTKGSAEGDDKHEQCLHENGSRVENYEYLHQIRPMDLNSGIFPAL